MSVEITNGARVGAVERWEWPDAFEGVTVEMAGQVYDTLGEMDPPARESVQSKDWAGYIVARICGFGLTDKINAQRRRRPIRQMAREAGRAYYILCFGADNIAEFTRFQLTR